MIALRPPLPAALIAAAALSSASGAFDLRTGNSFPDLPLPVAGQEAGELMSVADFEGRKLVLHLFASW